MQGEGNIHKFDVGVVLGTPGMKTDDIQEAVLYVYGIGFDDIDFEKEWGVRLTSVGKPGSRREESSKIIVAGCA
jgi:hypothetical protein